MSGYRLARGGRIDRDRRLEFTFNGRPLYGYAGDTLASALIASGVDVVARSFKYRRPRGVIGAGEEEPAPYCSWARARARWRCSGPPRPSCTTGCPRAWSTAGRARISTSAAC